MEIALGEGLATPKPHFSMGFCKYLFHEKHSQTPPIPTDVFLQSADIILACCMLFITGSETTQCIYNDLLYSR